MTTRNIEAVFDRSIALIGASNRPRPRVRLNPTTTSGLLSGGPRRSFTVRHAALAQPRSRARNPRSIYLVSATVSFVVLFAALTDRHGLWFSAALSLVSLEMVIFIAAGMKCSLTALAVKYGASSARPADTFLPETPTRHTLAVFGP
jgi:hypothetical protein